MTAEIISVGTELLLGQIADTNAQYLGQALPGWGVRHHFRQTVGDNRGRVVAALQLALSRSDVVFTIGGLGPTEDDLTREAIADVLGVDLEFVSEYAEKLRKLFALRKLIWLDSIERQAYRPMGASFLENRNGTAPGVACPVGAQLIIALPGPRGEFIPMVDGPVRELLAQRATGEVIHSRIIRVCAMGESQIEGLVKDLIANANPSVAPYAKLGEVHLRLTARASSVESADFLLDPIEEEVRKRLGWRVFGCDETSLEAACLALMSDRGLTLVTAESLTGGGLGQRLTGVPGSSKVYLGGVIAYSSALKTSLLQVPVEVFQNQGPVSRECALAMAEGGKSTLDADVCLSLTGNAGPDVDAGGKPVGLVYCGLATPDGTRVEEYQYRNTREDTRLRAIQAALTSLYAWLCGATS